VRTGEDSKVTTDPNMLLSTTAQIAATIVSILGGFLLTLLFPRITQSRQFRSEWAKVQEDAKKIELGEIEVEKLMKSASSIKVNTDHEQSRKYLEESKNTLLKHKAESESVMQNLKEFRPKIDLIVMEAKIIVGGLAILIGLAIVGIGIPLFVMPIENGEHWETEVWIAQRGTLVCLGLLILYLVAIMGAAANRPYFESKLERFVYGLVALSFVVWIMLPPAWPHWIAVINSWISVLTLPAFWGFNKLRQWSATRELGIRLKASRRFRYLLKWNRHKDV
jgi:hypothetical protein